MTISQNSQYVLAHPFTRKAVKSFLSGNPKDLKFLLDLLQIDTYQEVACLCTKAFKSNKKENYPQIEEAIREVCPPVRLNIKLPIPAPECIVISMKANNGTHRKIVINPMQLKIDFTKKEQQFPIAL